METLAQAIRDKNVEALMTHYAPDVVVFDLRPPLQVRGADAYRKNFEAWFASVQGPIDFAMRDLQITTSNDIAFAHYLARVRSTSKTAKWADYSVRVTAGCRRVNGAWLIAHEHISVPVSVA